MLEQFKGYDDFQLIFMILKSVHCQTKGSPSHCQSLTPPPLGMGAMIKKSLNENPGTKIDCESF